MFSLMLSSEDFPTPMESVQPEAAGTPRPPMIGTPVSRSTFPPSQASHSLSQPFPPPPPLPPSTSVQSVFLVPDQTGVSPASSGLPPLASLATQKPANPLKRCEDDVQFVSEKPVKRRKLDSPPTPNPTNAQSQKLPIPQTGPESSHVVDSPAQGKDEGSRIPACNPTHPLNAGPEHTPKPTGSEMTAEATSPPSSLENYVFPTGFSGPASCYRDSPQISPKQTLRTEPLNPLWSVNSQAEVSFPQKSQEPLRQEDGAGGIGADARPKDPENETAPSLGQSNQTQQPGGDVEPINSVTTQQMPPMSGKTTLVATGSAQRHETPKIEASPKDGLMVKDTSAHSRSTSRELADNKQQHGITAPSTTLLPDSQLSPLTYNPAPTRAQHSPAGSPMPVPGASISCQLNPRTSNPWPHSGETLSANTPVYMLKTEEHGSPPSVPKTTCQKPMGPRAPAGSQMLRRSSTQLQVQLSTPVPTRQQAQIHPQAHTQGQNRGGLHPPGSGPSKAHCRICAARRQQAVLQRAVLSENGTPALPRGTLPPGTIPPHAQAQVPNGAPYNVVFVPTPVQRSNGPNGAQFNPRPNQSTTNTGIMGMPSHPYMVQNLQQGMMAGPALQTQASRAPQANMTSQTAQSRPEERVSSPQNPAPRKFVHQEPSPGKHIIVDIADTAMEVFPFKKVAQRHNVPVDKIRNIFEAVVAIPFLRVPADKRRAGRIGQERVRNYVNTKKEVEKARVVEGKEGSQVTVYDMAAAMGPEEQPPKVPNGSASGFRGPW